MAARKNAFASAPSLALYAQNFVSAMEKNVVPTFTNRLSWSLHKICNCKGTLSATFSRMLTESKDILENVCIRENHHMCDVLHLLGQKFTHFWIRIIDIILEITNCKEIFS